MRIKEYIYKKIENRIYHIDIQVLNFYKSY